MEGGALKWEEVLYWSHFHSVQFFQTLSGDYDQQLAIPQKFVNNLRERFTGTVSLKGPSGALWNVKLTAIGDTLFFQQGWKEFVEDHALEENDLLIFRYKGDLQFDVLMFDGQNSCEKEASYFVKICGQPAVDSGCKRKDTPADSFEVTNKSLDDVEITPSKRPRKNDARTSRSTGRKPRASGNTWRTKSTSMRGVQLELSSNRREVSEEEKEKALRMAQSVSSEDSCVIIMRRTHVYKGFYMSIPSEWVKTHLPRKSRNVTLRAKERTWQAKFLRTDYGGALTGGWRNFVCDNFLEEFDVCLFKLASKTNDDIVIDVSIFRVVEEVIPPSRVTPVCSRGRKSSKYISHSNLFKESEVQQMSESSRKNKQAGH